MVAPHPAFSDAPLAPPAELAAGLRRLLPGWHVTWLDATASTNADLQQYLRRGGAGPALLGSHEQTAGRGRAGRPWRTRAGDALLFSCGWQADIPPARLPPLSLVAGLAACEALSGLLGSGADGALALKWPNDVQWNTGKLAGILVETVAVPASGRMGLILGIGINLHGAAALSRALGREVADWARTGGADDPARLAAAVARSWHDAIAHYAAEGFGPFQTRFARWDALYGLPVRVMDNGRILFEGTARGVDESGKLLVHAADGPHAVTVGDISVRTAEA
ncbi:biotin--[acetyl-CoA-carboxylase] ligase [Pigmentiphaga sp.]|uniref:biotin--[acetyl-CoA-carboxylase] ligase n=1 Tax=Pigmentiphaga sp. TaxID=1977564 RepID=UPI00128E62B1|nr:biotin--[acetyl-CoA-carboxylase] ligase [Pigmentiphaga sp.]MPS51658.1 biotin--[acetyl-CoA-carboxylase] ligase [Alcaligenaceae bacterium SAGV3]MPT55476.1 biotin--[acetyl-CoA-carboxylase] ligase [Alcaligenaceae bacterium]